MCDNRTTCRLCDTHFQSQYAYINNIKKHVSDITNKLQFIPRCINGHELIHVAGTKNRAHFRHKNKGDATNSKKGEWHCRIQAHFPSTEVSFPKISEQQLKDREADIHIKEGNFIVEVQHSEIADSEVKCRDDDYKLNNQTVVWIVDGNTSDVIMEKLSDGNFLITFKKTWKFKSFVHVYEFILLEIDDNVFKVPVRKVCNRMILLKESKKIEDIVTVIKSEPHNLWKQWEDDNEIRATLTLHQKGAGNGKTYGIWKSIVENKDKDFFLILTKQHSAKEVISKELKDQSSRHEYHIIENIEDTDITTYGRQIVTKYKHKKNERICTVIIGTIDSWIFSLTDKEKTISDFCKSQLINLLVNGLTKVNKYTGLSRYGGEQLLLNKKVQIWIDEGQDLNRDYFDAIVKTMLNTKVDVDVVGDELQSLDHEENLVTLIGSNIPNILIKREKAININRRIKNSTMHSKINNLVPFTQFNLPEISLPEDYIKNTSENEESLQIIHLYGEKEDYDKLPDHIITLVTEEVNRHGYLPEDFLFIWPIMKDNIQAAELETKLNVFWHERYNTTDKYMNYAILHKHQEGQVIDTKLSEKASRLVSIKTSKGDGRKVVFVLDCTEKNIKILAKDSALIFESYFHVSLTRSKNKVYFALEENRDNIHRRFGDSELSLYQPEIKLNISIDNIKDNVNHEEIIKNLFNKNGINGYENNDIQLSRDMPVIDWEYHCIRRAVYLAYCYYTILTSNPDEFKKSQIHTVLNNLKNLPVKRYKVSEFYKDNFHENDDKYSNVICIPLCELTKKKHYEKLLDKIEKTIDKIQRQLRKDIIKAIIELTPFEMFILHYILSINRRGVSYCDISPNTLYNITNEFSQHDDTKLTQFLKESIIIKDCTEKALKYIIDNDTSVKWNIEHMIILDSKTPESGYFKICYPNINIIGFSDDNCYHIVCKTDFNELNYWDTLIEILIQKIIIGNPNDKGSDKYKFKTKKLITYIFILKENRYEKIEWEWLKYNTEVKNILKNAVIKHFSGYNEQLFHCSCFIKKDKEIWKNFPSPYDYIANKYKKVGYINNFFKFLHEMSKNNKTFVKNLTDDKELFCQKLTEYIKETCNNFFGLITIDDNEEW